MWNSKGEAMKNARLKISRRSMLQGVAATSVLSAASLISSRGQAAEFVYKYANQVPASHPMTVFAQKAADRIREESGGRLDVQVFPNNQLGGDTDMLSQLRSGALEFFSVSGVAGVWHVSPDGSVYRIGFARVDYS